MSSSRYSLDVSIFTLERIFFTKADMSIDFAVFEFFDNNLNMSATTNEGFKKVPLFWVTPERSYARKFRDLRDNNGMVIYPLMTIERKGINNNFD